MRSAFLSSKLSNDASEKVDFEHRKWRKQGQKWSQVVSNVGLGAPNRPPRGPDWVLERPKWDLEKPKWDAKLLPRRPKGPTREPDEA